MQRVSGRIPGRRRIGVLGALLWVLLWALLLPWAGTAAAAAGPPGLGPPPRDCGAIGRDYADPSCTAQTRNGTFALERHSVRAGGTLTGTISNRCTKHPGGDFAKPSTEPCPIVWDGLLAVGRKVAGCTPAAASCTVRAPTGAQSTGYRIVTVGITSDQGTGISKDYFAVIGAGLFELGGHVVGRDGKPLAEAVTVRIAGPQGATATTDRASGLYTALLKKGTYTVSATRGDLKPVETSECVVVGSSCKVSLTQDRTADFELPGAPLLMETSLGPLVHGSTYHDAARAGTAIVIKATLRNTSRTKRIVVAGESLWPALAGNAFDGHLQPASAPVYVVGKDAGGSRLSPDVLLQPKQTREFAFIVRTRSLNVDWYGTDPKQAVPRGSTTRPARITILRPRVGLLPKGSLASLKAKDVKWLGAAAGTELKGKTTYEVAIDDTDQQPPPWDGRAFAAEVLFGVPQAILTWTWGTIRGIAWDLPNAAAAWGFGALYATDALTELSQALANAPEGGAAYLRYAKAVEQRIDLEHEEAKFLADHSPGFLDRLQGELRRHWTTVAEEYYHGDWHQAAATISEEGTHAVLNVVTLVAPGVLARLPGIQQLAQAYRARVLAQSAAEAAAAATVLDGAAAAEIGRSAALFQRVKRALAAVKALRPGLKLGDGLLQSLYGFTRKQLQAIEEVGSGAVTGGRRIVSSWAGRSKFAAAIKDALGKPSWMKPKGIELADVEYLGESAAELSTQVWTEPPLLALARTGESGRRAAATQYIARLRSQFAQKGRALTAVDEKAALAQWSSRISEWTTDAKGQIQDLLRRAKAAEAKGGRTTVAFEHEGNFVDASIKNQSYEVGYTLERTTTDPAIDPWGPRTRYVPRITEEGGSVLQRVVSDQDPLLFQYANGKALSDADRLAVYRYLRQRGIISHGDTGSYANAAVRKQILTDGLPSVTLGPDGRWVVSRYAASKSKFVNPGDFRQVFDGLELVPLAP